jgi:hypothetical protein
LEAWKVRARRRRASGLIDCAWRISSGTANSR